MRAAVAIDRRDKESAVFLPVMAILLALIGEPASAQPKADLSVMVPMSDGVELATDIYLPKEGGPAWPTRVIRTPYGCHRYNNEYGSRTERGYAMVVQDMRGRFRSQGKDLAFMESGWSWKTDGRDTIKWILEQPWCNGKIATEGASAMGITQYMLGGTDVPGLECQYILVAAPSLYHHATYMGGGLRASLVVGWLTWNNFHPDNIWLVTLHPLYDYRWENVDAIARAEKATAPAVHFAGWFDVFQQGNIDGFVARQNNGGDGARGTQKLIIGPWGHGEGHGKRIGELMFPRNTEKYRCKGNEWFDHYLKGVDNGVERVPAVQYYTMGALGPDDKDAPGNMWNTSDVWPVPHTPTPFYLHADGKLSRKKPTTDQASCAFDYNPLKPVPTRGGCLLNLPSGPFDQRDLEERPDVITFTTEPLAEPVEITGRIIANLTIASNRVDTDFTVKLTDVYPDGTSMSICDGLVRCRTRKGFDRLALLTPGEPAEVQVDCWSTSIIFNEGHRIRVAISSSNYPKYDVNPNTGWPGVPMQPVLPAHNQVFCDRMHASHIVLPVIE
jgi:predicted acyl esterase